MKETFQAVSQNLRDNFIDDVVEADWTEVGDRERPQLLGNQSYEGVILLFQKMIFFKEIPNKL
jgi:hypothetical protein